MFIAGYIATQVISFVPVLAWVSLLGVVLFIIVQNKLNESWHIHEPARAVKAPMMQADWITVGIGLAVWAIGILVVVVAVASS